MLKEKIKLMGSGRNGQSGSKEEALYRVEVGRTAKSLT
jgi:hypothetical protein